MSDSRKPQLSALVTLIASLAVVACARDERDTDVSLRVSQASEYGLARPNTLEDPAFGQPLSAAVYFDPDAFQAGASALAYAPDAIFDHPSVTFGNRLWQRTGPTRFELAGSNGAIAFEYTSDFKHAQFLHDGNHRAPLHFQGTLANRKLQAGFSAVLGMSGFQPSNEVVSSASMVPGLFWLLDWLLEGEIAMDDPCPAFLQSCEDRAIDYCLPQAAHVDMYCNHDSHGAMTSSACTYTCYGGGDGGAGSGVGSVGGSASNSDSASASNSDSNSNSASNSDSNSASNSDSNSASNGDGDGGGNGSGDSGGGGGCGDGFDLGGVPGLGGILDYAAADEDGNGGGGSTGC